MINIRLTYGQLRFDLEQLAHRYAEARLQPGDTKDLAQVEQNDSDGKLLMRLMQTGTASLGHVLRDYLVTDGLTDGEDDLYDTDDAREFAYLLKDMEADPKHLADLMHWYVVKAALLEWAKMFAPADTDSIAANLKETEVRLTETAEKSPMPMKTRRAAMCGDTGIIDITYIG